ncbi:MAG: hypothetical protein AB1813_18255 [Verrucomicrobiota bacterium]
MLEKLWLEVINIDSKGEWMNRSLGALHALQVTPLGRVPLTETNAAGFLPDGVLVASDASHLRFFAANTWKETFSIEGGGDAYDIAVSPVEKLIVVSQFSGVRVWRF